MSEFNRILKGIIKAILVALGAAIVLIAISGVILDAAYLLAYGLEGLDADSYINSTISVVAYRSLIGFLIIALGIYVIPEISDRSKDSEE